MDKLVAIASNSDSYTGESYTSERVFLVATDPYARFSKFRMSTCRSLKMFISAPDSYGFYEIGIVRGRKFVPKYGGRAAGTTLRQRMRKHFVCSHNHKIAKAKRSLYFRYWVTNNDYEARYVEALHIAAMDYPWNKRNEWEQHWAFEDFIAVRMDTGSVGS